MQFIEAYRQLTQRDNGTAVKQKCCFDISLFNEHWIWIVFIVLMEHTESLSQRHSNAVENVAGLANESQ